MASEDVPSRPPTPAVEEKETILSEKSDFTITVLSERDNQGCRRLKRFKVSKEAITAGSEYFAASVRFNSANEHPNTILKDDDIGAIHICLASLHAKSEEHARELWSSVEIRNISIAQIWCLIDACDKYQFTAEMLKEYFKMWYMKNVNISRMDLDFARQLGLPCFFFDHAQGFADVTKWLAYNSPGHISELKPINIKWNRLNHMHLGPPDFVGPMNHARGSLKTSLHRGLWKHVGKILEDDDECTCGHWAEVAGHYFKELVNTGAYPLEETFPKTSVNKLLSRLDEFTMPRISNVLCALCREVSNDSVEAASAYTARNFDGLCIDCMDKSRYKRKDPDQDYWLHLKSEGGRWDHNCRVLHGQQSWYVSWCGRDEHRQKLLKMHRDWKTLGD